jgi:multiple sugar transport system permease protein
MKTISPPLGTDMKDIRQEVLMILPAVVLLAVFLATPFFSAIQLSFTNQRLVQGPSPTRFVGFRNYAQILSDGMFWRAFLNVVLFAAIVIPVQCGFALFLAILLDRQQFLKGILRGVFFIPFVTPMVIVAVVWLTLYQYPSGVLNSFLVWISAGRIEPVLWLGNPNTALLAIVVLSAWQAYSFQMIIYLGGLQQIPNELYEAASIDGAGPLRQFVSITWPSLRNTNVLILIITTILAFKLFTQVNILTRGGPNGATNTLIHYIYEAGFVGQRIGYSSAASVLFFLIVLGVFLIQRAVLGKGEV